MTFSARCFSVFASLWRRGASPGVLAAAVLAAMAVAPNTAAGRNARPVGIHGTYDGTWNVVFITRAGNCSSTNNAPFTVSGRRLFPAGGGKVTGGISPVGYVSVRISLGLSAASGTGRLVGNSGAGRWSGIISGDRCSGTWQASRG